VKVAFAGLGIMGSRMAANLVRAGHELRVWNRTQAKAEDFAAAHRATAAPSARELPGDAGVVVTMLVDGPQVDAVVRHAAAGAREGTLFVDMSTIAPDDARRLSESLTDRGMRFVDAPVTGSSPKAEAGTLTIMASGAAADVEQARPLFEAMGELVVNVGEQVGDAQTIKLINNAVAAANANTLGQALLVGKAAGVDLDALVEVMGAGSGGSTMLALKSGPMRDHDYTTLFKLEHMLKDVRHCLEAAQAAGAPFPAAASAREVLNAAMGRGLGDADFAALVEVLEGFAGRRL
jgi:3-hydroxyisobutyrate dehydrogenase